MTTEKKIGAALVALLFPLLCLAPVRIALGQTGKQEPPLVHHLRLSGGNLSVDRVSSEVERHHRALLICQALALAQDPKLEGSVLISFTVEASGEPSGVTLVWSELDHEQVESCLLQVVQKMLFNPPLGGWTVDVKLQLRLPPLRLHPRDILLRVYRLRQPRYLDSCFFDAQDQPLPVDIPGRIVIDLDVAASGRVARARVWHTTLGSERLESCIVDRIRALPFPNPHGVTAQLRLVLSYVHGERPDLDAGRLVVWGGLDRQQVQTAVARRAYRSRACFGADGPHRVDVQLLVDGEGRVVSAGVRGSTLQDPEVERCLVQVAQGLRFPRPDRPLTLVVLPFAHP